MDDISRVIKCRAFRWVGVEVKPYQASEAAPFKDVTRQNLLGGGSDEGALRFITRYFEVQPGGYTTLELHRHAHAVIVMRGSGQVVLDEEAHEIAPFDCVYVAPGSTHQFRATGREALGFLCVVDRVRDRPRAVGADRDSGA